MADITDYTVTALAGVGAVFAAAVKTFWGWATGLHKRIETIEAHAATIAETSRAQTDAKDDAIWDALEEHKNDAIEAERRQAVFREQTQLALARLDANMATKDDLHALEVRLITAMSKMK